VGELTTDDVRHWDPSVVEQMFETASLIHGAHHNLGEDLKNGHERIQGWEGESGDACRQELDKVRVDVSDSGREAERTYRAVRFAAMDISGAKLALDEVDTEAKSYGWSITQNWTLDTSANSANVKTHADEVTRLQNAVAQAKSYAERADHELALAVRAAVGDAQLNPDGREAHGPQTPPPKTDNKTTPADQLPLTPKNGQKASPAEGTAERHDHPELGGKGYLATNPHPSPLLAGLSADEWRQRLAHFKPGDALPDPRTPTGDKAIDSLANAVGQQNSTYAWGGNRSNSGPTSGVTDNGKDATKYDDQHRVGYDCGGLVRYSVQQGAGIDVGMGTGAIDGAFPHADGMTQLPSGNIGGRALPGDVLVFTEGSGHTGIYIGNGYMINAPDSGNPVRVDAVGPGRGPTDILRIPSR
jgi:cell wall-associated NlpC family hydrolase